jgi:NAD(P)-dependent dehydrogenase (short-subunit alcohol dehydrogenase family)
MSQAPTQEKPLAAKVALVTGASRGIGLAIAKSLAAMGAKIAVCARDPQRLDVAAADLERSGASVVAVPADVSRPAEIPPLVEKTERSLGPIEILVNNAGIGVFGPIQDASEANWDAVLNTNLKSVFLLSRAVAPGMISRRTGHIVNIASLAGKTPLPAAEFTAPPNGDSWVSPSAWPKTCARSASASAPFARARWPPIFRRIPGKTRRRCCSRKTSPTPSP